MLVGMQGCGKSTRARELEAEGFFRLNRDSTGGRLAGLVSPMLEALRSGSDVVLDNTNLTAEVRASFLAPLRGLPDVEVTCEWFDTSLEDCQINVLNRMHSLFGRVLLSHEDIKSVESPAAFPICVLFKSRKMFEEPTAGEGFARVDKIEFTRRPIAGYTNRALFIDYDGTLRRCKSGAKYPTDPEDIEVLPRRSERLREYRDKGFILLGVSNQSGISAGKLSEEDAVRCFERTNELLDIDIEYNYCAHSSVPISCYCRKPQSGMGIKMMHRHKLDLSQCIMIGDLTSDKTFAKRLGMKFSDAEEFFA